MNSIQSFDRKTGQLLYEPTGEIRVPRPEEFYSLGMEGLLEQQGVTFLINVPMKIYRPTLRP